MGALTAGCGSCKRRKVKCDNTLPKCIRCRKAGIECTGFRQRLRYVDENPRIKRSMAVSHAQSHNFSTSKSDLVSPANPFPWPQPAPFLADTLPLTAFKDDIFISYLYSKLFEAEHQGESQCGLPKDWILELAETPQKPRSKSWDALAAIVFGQAHKNNEVVTKALKLYGHALCEIRKTLSNHDHRRTDSTLASMTALYIYEILLSKTEQGWMLHANGLGSLLECRGPWQQKPYAGTSIFLEHRIMLVAKSIISRRTTFLRDPTWKSVPWEDDRASKSFMDYLVDVGADIAEYLARIKPYECNKSTHELEYSQIRIEVAASLGELNTWWCEWEAVHPHPAVEVISHPETRKPLFPTHFEYESLWTAFTVSVYNAMRILLLQLWHRLQHLPPNPTQATTQPVVLNTPNGTALLGITSDSQGLASEILRSLKYCYGKSRRFVSTFTFLFIQDVAYGCFERGSEEALWVAEHGWADLGSFPDIEDANLLKRLLPLRQIHAGDIC